MDKIFKTLAERLVYHPRKNGLKKNATLYRLMLIQNRHTTRRDNGWLCRKGYMRDYMHAYGGKGSNFIFY